MSPVLPFEIIALIIDIVGENEDKNLLKELALVSHYFLQICSKHLFATVELHDAVPKRDIASSKKGFVKLLKGSPDVVKYIRKLTYRVGLGINNDNHLLTPILSYFLLTIPHLNCLKITTSGSVWRLDWKKLDSSLTSALLHLMHLPTINRIDLSYIEKFPLSSLFPCVNLLRLDLFHMVHIHENDDDSFEIVQSEVMPKLREFRTSGSSVLTRKLLHAKMQDGRPAFDPMNFRRLLLYDYFEDEWNIRYLLQNANLLEGLRLRNDLGQSIVGLHDILSPIACTLKVLHLTIPCFSGAGSDLFSSAWRFCEELEAMAGHNVLEALTFEIGVDGSESEDSIGNIIQKVGEVLVKSGWPALRQVVFEVAYLRMDSAKLEALRSLISEKYLSHFSELESVAFNFSIDVFVM